MDQATGERWRLGHRPTLDGLRGVAILLVVICHAHVPRLGAAGAVGVTIFFTLSGFLITSLLLDEHERTGTVRLGRFYVRRALRLLPALFTAVAVLLLVGLALGSRFMTVKAALATLLYSANWAVVGGLSLGALQHTWSLAVEEQFYLVWPLLLLVAARRGTAAVGVTAAGGMGAAILLRMLVWDDGAGFTHVYYGSATHADALLAGALLAVAMRRLADGPGLSAWAAVGLFATVPLWLTRGFGEWMLLPTVVPLLTCGVIFCVARGHGALWLARGPLCWLGRRSYGLYLWDWPASWAVTLLVPGWSWQAQAAVMVPAALLLTVLSWRFLEQPFLRLKDRPRSVVAEPVAAALQ